MRRSYIAPTVRDWALTYWAIIDGTKKLSRNPAGPIIVGGIILAMALYALFLLIWKEALLVAAIYILAKWWKRYKDLNKPVPWDDDYRPEQDDDIPY